MTLEDLMKPNKFGTVPMLIIPGIGYGVVTDNYLKLNVADGTLAEHALIPLTTSVIALGDGYAINHEELIKYYYRLEYYLPLTSEQYLINNAVNGIKEILVTCSNMAYTFTTTEEKLAGRLDDGTGWMDFGYGMEPVTYYVEDILYRLDLQGKLT